MTFHNNLKEYLEIALTKHVKDLQIKTQTLKKEIKEGIRIWKEIPWINRINNVKVTILPNQSTD